MPDSQSLPLRDIHLPEAVSWWPPAPGWWAVTLFLLLMFVVMVLWWRSRRRLRPRLQKVALKELAQLQGAYQQHQDDRQLVRSLSVLLRRICISIYPAQQVAGLTGETWLRFLDQAITDHDYDAGSGFANGPGRVLLDGPYQPDPENIDADSLVSLCRRWIRQLPIDGAGAGR